MQNGTAVVLQNNLAEKVIADYFQGKTPEGVITFDHDYQIHMGGIEAQLMHYGNAYSSGDTVVYFPNLKVVAVGNLYGAVPVPDFGAGGSVLQWGPVLEQVLKLDFDTAVSHRHALLTRTNGSGWIIRDIGSSNGTRVNGEDVKTMADTPLKPGDRVTLGHWTCLTISSETHV